MSIDDKILPVIPTWFDLYEMEDKFLKRGERILELEAQLERINMCAAVRLDDCPDMSRLEYVVKLSDIEAAIKDQSNE